MNVAASNIPGYQVNEYKIILAPHEELATRIIMIKKEFVEKYAFEKFLRVAPVVDPGYIQANPGV